MPRLIDLLNNNKMTLIVALPGNDPEMAEAAVAGGADALQLHINLSYFKTFYEEKEALLKIVKGTAIPVGIVPGHEVCADEEEMKEIKKIGFDFFSMDIDHVPSYMLKIKGLARVLALNENFTLEKLMADIHKAPDALNAAILPASGKGKPLVVGDLQNYISIVLSAGVPVIIPTERSIKSSEVAILGDTGAKGLLITSVLTGDDPKKIEKVTREFRIAADDL